MEKHMDLKKNLLKNSRLRTQCTTGRTGWRAGTHRFPDLWADGPHEVLLRSSARGSIPLPASAPDVSARQIQGWLRFRRRRSSSHHQ